ncbi:hypothetical protein PMIN06_005483 [Paraphaeosphaeria minitans]
MPGIQSAGGPPEDAATDASSEQQSTQNNTENTPAKDADDYGFPPDFDFWSAAKKLKCDEDPDAVVSAIGILLQELHDCKMKVDFFETLFGYRSEHLMAYDQHLLRHDDIRFYGQRRLQGKMLQQAMLEQNGHEPSLAELKGKSVILTVPEEHYDFAVVLPMKLKNQVDRELNERHAQNAQTANGIAGDAAEDAATELQKKKLAVKKAAEKEKRRKILSRDQEPAGEHAADDMLPSSRDAAADVVVGQKPPNEKDAGLAEAVPPTSQNAAVDVGVAQKTSTEKDAAASAVDKERKRKRAIVASDDEGDDGNAKASRLY